MRTHLADPGFARALASAALYGVMMRAARFHLTPSGRAAFRGFIPVHPD